MKRLENVSFVFDLDGTLVDTAPDLLRVLNDVIADDGLPPVDQTGLRALIGNGAAYLINTAYEQAGYMPHEGRPEAALQDFLDRYEANICELSVPFDGVEETLIGLKRSGARLSIATNKPGWLARPLMTKLGLDQYFKRIYGPDDVPAKKPSAEHIYAAAGHRGRHPIVMVGDSGPDAFAAKAAGAISILMGYGYSPTPLSCLPAHDILRSFRHVPLAALRHL